ncbi:DJ-1/PfpI family protein, partial [Blastomonas sp.]|uniref:DJ-1/PfpI family protein n=1 Tax=Blastomonas sp. TaxID=1909299 RepID=UPI0035933909
MINAPLAVSLDMIHAVHILAPQTRIETGLFAAAPEATAGIILPSALPLEAALRQTWHAVVIPGLGHAHAQSPALLMGGSVGALLCKIVSAVHAQGGRVAASCSGTFVAAQAGLLDGGNATTSWWLAPQFRAAFPAVILDDRQMVCEDGRVLTGGGALAHIELMQTLVRQLVGSEVADAVGGFMVSPRRGPQSAQGSVMQIPIVDPVVAEFIRLVGARLERAVPVAEIAATLST